MSVVEIEGQKYEIGKMSAEVQFHVFRRVMPLIRPIMISLRAQGLQEGSSITGKVKAEILTSIADDLAEIPDERLNYVIDNCMNVVSRVVGDQKLPLKVHGQRMFQDMDMLQLLMIMWAVLMETFGPFLTALLAGPSQGEGPASPTS